MNPQEIFPTSTEVRKNRSYYRYKTLTYRGQKMIFNRDIRTGVCYFCKKEERLQRSHKTYLHHLKYDDTDPLAWTLEICSSCHYQVDINNQRIIDRYFYKKRQEKFAQYRL